MKNPIIVSSVPVFNFVHYKWEYVVTDDSGLIWFIDFNGLRHQVIDAVKPTDVIAQLFATDVFNNPVPPPPFVPNTPNISLS